MANIYVFGRIFKFRSLNRLIAGAIQSPPIEASSKLHRLGGPPNTSTKLNESSINFARGIRTSPIRLTNKQDDSDAGQSKSSSIDDFRAKEERIEREYEDKHRQQTESQHQQQQQQNDEKENEKIQTIRCQILDAALPFVKTHGWSREAIAQGAASINYPSVVHGMFPNGSIELIHHFYAKCNREVIDQLQLEVDARCDTHVNPVEFATRAIRLRLEKLMPFADNWPQAIAMMALPPNVPTSLAHLLTFVDDICFMAGDRSVDIGWYTRRVGIASIYKMTELYLLQDKSPERKNTWEFLSRRMEDGVHVQDFLSASDPKNVGRALGSAFETARNILGINVSKK